MGKISTATKALKDVPLRSFMRDLDSLFDSLKSRLGKTEISKTDVEFNSNSFVKDTASNFGIDPGAIESVKRLEVDGLKKADDAVGDLVFKTKDGELNITKVKRLFDDGEFARAFDELDPKGEWKKDPAITKMADDLTISFNQTERGIKLKALKDIDNAKATLLKKNPNLKEADLADVNNKTPEALEYQRMQDKYKNIKNDIDNLSDVEKQKIIEGEPPASIKEKINTMFGPKVKLLLGMAVLAFLIYAAKDFSDFLKKVADAMSGCWLEHGNAGGKCKIDALTCDEDAISATTGGKTFDIVPLFHSGGFDMCTVNLGYNGNVGSGTGDWIPLLKDYCKCDSTQSNIIDADYDPQIGKSITSVQPIPKQAYNSCTSNTACAVKPLTGAYATIPPVCNHTSGCVSWAQACMESIEGGRCSKWCNKSNPAIVTGLFDTLSCVDADWKDAFIASSPVDFTGGISSILGYLKLIAIGLVVLFLVFFAFKWLVQGAMGSSEEPPRTQYRTQPRVVYQQPRYVQPPPPQYLPPPQYPPPPYAPRI